MAAKATTKQEATETREESADGPLMDGTAAAIKKMLARSKERGYVTYDEVNAALPPEQTAAEQIEDTLAMLNEMGINVVESEETEDAAPAEQASDSDAGDEEDEGQPSGNINDDIGRTDDPVRMYLREMGSVELLSREGEIAIAKRIEAGRDMMIGGICENPMTYRALLAWRDKLRGGTMLLRDIIDLDATYGGTAAAAAAGQPGQPGVPGANGAAAPGPNGAAAPAPAEGEAQSEEEELEAEGVDEEEDMEAVNMSLA